MFSKNDFAAKVRLLRLDAGLSQPELGEALGLSKQTVNDMEKARSTTVADKVAALSAFFSVPADFLLGNPPFDQWEVVMEHREELTEQLASFLSAVSPGLADRLRAASLPEFITFVGACLSLLRFDPEHRSFDLVFHLPTD